MQPAPARGWKRWRQNDEARQRENLFNESIPPCRGQVALAQWKICHENLDSASGYAIILHAKAR